MRCDRRRHGDPVQPVGFTEQQLASRYLFTLTMRVAFTDARTEQGALVERRAAFREEYELTTRSNTALEGVDVPRPGTQLLRPHRHRRRAHRRDRHPRGVLSMCRSMLTSRRRCREADCVAATPRRSTCSSATTMSEKSAVAARVRRHGGRGPARVQRRSALRRRDEGRRPGRRREHAPDDGAAARRPRARGREAAHPEAREQGGRRGAGAARGVPEGAAAARDGRLRVRRARHAAPRRQAAAEGSAGRRLRHDRGRGRTPSGG